MANEIPEISQSVKIFDRTIQRQLPSAPSFFIVPSREYAPTLEEFLPILTR
jgi:hypothetical protein